MKILVTGAAGFIGSKLARSLADKGHEVVGIDNINTYYDPNLKYGRLAHFYGITAAPDWEWDHGTAASDREQRQLVYPEMPWGREFEATTAPGLRFIRMDIADTGAVDALFVREKFDTVVNLAAQAGVRYSIENPMAYIRSNVVGFTNILESSRKHGVGHLVYASSSSVYGGNTKTPFAESDPVENQVSVYAATKRSNELLATTYSNLYGLHCTGLRFFTVYGPWGRPDMAPFLFSRAMLEGGVLNVFNNGNLARDFTYIDDIVEGTERVIALEKPAQPPYATVYNIGGSQPVNLMDFIRTLESSLDAAAGTGVGEPPVRANLKMCPMQPGDVYRTEADTAKLERDTGFRPHTTLEEGLAQFAPWYVEHQRR